ncbi:alpha-L-rhamnosidase [Proteiniphilum sp. UBA5384]|uniref:alpha-L-rhamnosidase n=1 Tax=Proteiniphilum sp. UBA5384 TaxID=1947279 RepID=UPI0025F8BE53|nr:alpha-L-rhamnosidase [Proteiniphilum sp. UBA5384]
MSVTANDKKSRLVSLEVEYEETPLGIDVKKPRFSWQMASTEKGISQKGYQIIVTNEKKNQVWNSGKILSDISLNIEYSGEALSSSTRYHWKLFVWDSSNRTISATSWFETGLMDPSLLAWEGAEWIGGSEKDLVLYPDYFPTYNISYTVQLDEENNTTKAGFLYGVNDPRLMDKNLNIYNLQSGKDESYIEAELDITELKHSGNAVINLYRVGYAPSDSKDKPLHRLTIPLSIINSQNRNAPHTIYLKTMYSTTEIFIDGEEESNKIGRVTINPLGGNWNYICFPLLCDIGFSMKPHQKAHFSEVIVRNYRVPNNILFSETQRESDVKNIFSGEKNITITNKGYMVNGNTTGKIVSANITKNSMPMLRREFKTQGVSITKARLYITARGIYEVYINGKQIGDDYFNPGLTQYNKHHLYQTYDVTEELKSGDNTIGVMLGEGWWSGAITYMGFLWNLFGDRQSLLSKLVITYKDGTQQTIVSNPETWRYYNNGPVIYSSFFQGEVYDARKESEIKGWMKPGFDDTHWKKAVTVNQERAIVDDPSIKANKMPPVNDFSELQLIGQFGPTVKKIKELTAVSMEEVRPGVFVYDMGQNMVGVPCITLRDIHPGTEIKLRYAEVKYPAMPEFKENVGMIMLENIRGALAQDIYITKGGEETIKPHFTFHGYRYIEITGIGMPLPLEAVKGDVLSSIHELSTSYVTSNPKVNKLWENITWSARGNFLSIPTDCPQRNERMGWSGDISVFSRTATYIGDMEQFLSRHMMAMRDTQREDGRFADVAPIGGGFGGILWGSAGITVAWENYCQYDDKKMLIDHYDAMKSYIDYLLSYIDPITGIMTEGRLGDWLGPEQDKNDNSLLWEAYFIYNLDLMQRIATILEKKDDTEWFVKMHRERKAFFNKTYINPCTGETIHSGFDKPEKRGSVVGTQTSYVLPLAFGAVDEKNEHLLVNRLIKRISNKSHISQETSHPPYSLMTGFIGTAWIHRVLSNFGYSESAYRIMQQEEYPSLLYSVNQGATTIWERLNSYTREKGFGGKNAMNSFNHYSFGAIGSWMVNYSLGIERDERYPGFKNFILRPEPDPTGIMTWAKGHYDSPYGRIESSWEISGNMYHYHFRVPANTTAILYLQAISPDKISEGYEPLAPSTNIEIKRVENGKMVIKLRSGVYQFSVRK